MYQMKSKIREKDTCHYIVIAVMANPRWAIFNPMDFRVQYVCVALFTSFKSF